MNQEVNVLALVKGKERYVFLYNEQNRETALETFGRFASDSQLSFSWYDAAALIQKVQREKRQTELKLARDMIRRTRHGKRAPKSSLYNNNDAQTQE
ncbi:MAG: hypothetical protein Q4G03_11460 [Planctomycetia bacterium]|nr:hypothetical protein [Planctomycetia bacterium]